MNKMIEKFNSADELLMTYVKLQLIQIQSKLMKFLSNSHLLFNNRRNTKKFKPLFLKLQSQSYN